MEARKGRAITIQESTVNVTDPSTSTTAQNLDQYLTYGHLAGASSRALYRFTHRSSCGVGFGIYSSGTNSTDVDIYVTEDPLGTAGTDGSTYTEKAESTNSSEIINWKVAAHGMQYAVLVKHKATESPYKLIHRTTNPCESGGNDASGGGGTGAGTAGASRHYVDDGATRTEVRIN